MLIKFPQERISLISIIYHIVLSLVQALDGLLAGSEAATRHSLEASLQEAISLAIKTLCSTSTPVCRWHSYFRGELEEASESSSDEHSAVSVSLIHTLQSAMLNTLTLKSKHFSH